MATPPKQPDRAVLSRLSTAAVRTAGLDEAGRGCLAGPVTAAAVILPPVFSLPGLADSKALTPGRRARLEIQIKACAIAWSIGQVWPRRIDKINILQASLEAMSHAAARLNVTPQMLLIDGNKTIPAAMLARQWRPGHHDALPAQEAIIAGDRLVPAISAASILAKTFRDREMLKLDKKWPAYGFAQHKGYGTRRHFAALRAHGPCPMHRLSFRGVLPGSHPVPDCIQLEFLHGDSRSSNCMKCL